MLIAKSRDRESVTEDGVVWWKEYRVVPDTVRGNYRLEDRYLARVGDKTYARVDGRVAMFTDPEAAWGPWAWGATPAEAVREVIGDSDFAAAESLHPVHAAEVRRLRAERDAGEARRRAKAAYDAAGQRLDDWRREQDRLFHKRHGGKSGAEYERTLARTRKRLQPEHDRLMAEVAAARAAWECLKAEAVATV